MPSHEPLKRPGRKPLSTSASVDTVIVLSVTPTSGLDSVAVLHAAFCVAGTVVLESRPLSPLEFLLLPLLPQPASASTTTNPMTPKRAFISPPVRPSGR